MKEPRILKIQPSIKAKKDTKDNIKLTAGKNSFNPFANNKKRSNERNYTPNEIMKLLESAREPHVAKKLEDIIMLISTKIFEGCFFRNEWAKALKELMLWCHKFQPYNIISYILSINNLATICDRNSIKVLDEQVINIDKLFSNAEYIIQEISNRNSHQLIVTKIKLLVNKALYLRHNERFEESNTEYEALLRISKTVDDCIVENLSVFYALTGLADVLDRKGRYQEALDKYNEAELKLEMIPQKITIRLIPSVWEKQAHILSHLKFYDEAEAKYLSALKVRRSEFKKENIYISNIYNSLGNLYKERGQYNDQPGKQYSGAFSCLKKALLIRKKFINSNSAYITVTLKHIGDTYLATGQHKKAIIHYNKALDLRRKSKNLRESVYMANLLNSLATAYLFDNNLDKAAECFLESSRIFNSSANNNLVTNQKFYTEFLNILSTKLNY